MTHAVTLITFNTVNFKKLVHFQTL